MITCDLRGGLGNQFFQILAILVIAKQNNVDFCFTDQTNLDGDQSILRYTYWNTLFKDLKKYTVSINDEYKEDVLHISHEAFEYNPVEYKEEWKDKKIMYHGYFQSYRYFSSHAKELFDFIGLNQRKQEWKENYPLILNQLQQYKTSISMHFRLGDYKEKQYFHPILTKDYYKNALSHIVSTYPVDEPILVLYFCEAEDNVFVAQTIFDLSIEFSQCIFSKCPDEMEDYNQMLCMSMCSHHIIANSSFSWFGAYLSHSEDLTTENEMNKIVCYPSVWFCGFGSHIQTHDLFPPKWIKI